MESLSNWGWLPVVFLGLMGLSMLTYVVLDGYDLGKAISKMPTPSTSQVSLASQNGPMLAIIMSLCSSESALSSNAPTPRSKPSKTT